MTVSSTPRIAGPFTGNGSQTAFPFSFKVFSSADVAVTRADTTGVESVLVLNSDYTVTLNSNQDSSPGGTVNLSTGLTLNYKLAITGNTGYSQSTDLPTGGAYNAQNVEDALDRSTILSQQLLEQLDRAVKVPVTSDTDPDDLLAELTVDVASAAASAAAAAASYDAFDDRYLGSKSSDPTLDNDGNALLTGALYWSTALNRMRAYTGSAWVDTGVATPVTINTQRFSGTGSQTVFTLTNAPAFQNAAEVFISGVRQVPGVDYTVTGAELTTLTFTSAPASGTNNIFVQTLSAYAGGVPNDGSVTTAKIADGSVTTAKVADASVTAGKMASGAAASNIGYTPADDSEVVHLTGNETIAGTKTFSSQPVLPQASTLATAQNTTSGTSVDFTGIPSWAKRVTVIFNGVSTSGTSRFAVRLGTSGGIDSSADYAYNTVEGASYIYSSTDTALVLNYTGGASYQWNGLLTLVKISGTTWIATWGIGAGNGAGAQSNTASGKKTLTGTLDRLRFTTVNGTDTFDAGSVNILYE